MKNFILALALAFTAMGCSAHNPPAKVVPAVQAPVVYSAAVDQAVQASIARFSIRVIGEMGGGTCTAQSIGARKFLTAAHCVLIEDEDGRRLHATFTVDGFPAFVVKVDPKLDLAIVVADEIKPSVHFRAGPTIRGEAVSAMGFGYGFIRSLITRHEVELVEYVYREGLPAGNIYLHPFIAGMSGGPVYDLDGNVVGMVQRGWPEIAYGVDSVTILEFINGK